MLGLDNIEVGSLEKTISTATSKLASLREGFSNRLTSVYDNYINYDVDFYDTAYIMDMQLHDLPDMIDDPYSPNMYYMTRSNTWNYDMLKNMYHGVELPDGIKTLGLEDLSKFKVNDDYKFQNFKQQAGFAAEIISTGKENFDAVAKKLDVVTRRADDLPELFSKNDPYVDKVRIDSKTGEILERVQTKFVGKDAESCLSKLTSKKYDKYFNDGKVDKVEVPKDYYDKIKALIPDKVAKLEEQLKHVENDPDPQKAENINRKLERFKKIDTMLEQSNTTSGEALFARKHPKAYVGKMWAKNAAIESHKIGVESGMTAAKLTVIVSSVDNIQKYMNGEISATDAVFDVVKDTGTAAALEYGTDFISTAVSATMSQSSHALIKSVASSGVPGVAISFGIDTYDSVVDFAQGNIDSFQLAYDLGEGAANIAGSMAGAQAASYAGMAVGGVVGSVVPGAGTAVGMAVGKAAGFGVGMVGGMVGCAIASEAYATAVEVGAENAGVLAEKAKSAAEGTIELAKVHAPEQVDNIRSAVNEYASKFNLPFSV